MDSDPLGPLVHVSSPAPFYQYGQCRALGADRVEALIQFSTPPPPPPHSRLPPCRDEFLLRPAVHVITVISNSFFRPLHTNYQMKVIIGTLRLPCASGVRNAKMRRGVGSNEGQLAPRARCPPSPVSSLLLLVCVLV